MNFSPEQPEEQPPLEQIEQPVPIQRELTEKELSELVKTLRDVLKKDKEEQE